MRAIDLMRKKGYLTKKEGEAYSDIFNAVYNRMFLKEIVYCWRKAVKALAAKAGDKILDVGDSGLVTARQIYDAYPELEKLTVVDIVSDRYRDAIKHRAKNIKNKVRFMIMDARQMKFSNQSFDKVIATNNINEIEGNWQKAVREMIRVLKVGGDLILTEHRLNYNIADDRLFSEVFFSAKEMHTNDIRLNDIVRFSSKLRVVSKYERKHTWFVHFKKIMLYNLM